MLGAGGESLGRHYMIEMQALFLTQIEICKRTIKTFAVAASFVFNSSISP